MKKQWENIKLIFKIFFLRHRVDYKITLFELLHGLCLNAHRVVDVIMPAFIVNVISEKTQWKYVLITTVGYGALKCLLGAGEKCFKHLQEAYGFKACNMLRLSMNKKFMQIDYADTENSTVTDMYEKAKDSMWEFCDVGYVIFNDIVGNLLSFVSMSYILSEINMWVYLCVMVFIILSMFLQHKKDMLTHESVLKEQQIKKHMNYIIRIMQSYEAGKELRMYDLKDFMLRKYKDFSGNYKEQVANCEKSKVKVSILQGILYFGQMLIVYMSAIKRYVIGQLQIGYFLLYISSINELSESIKNLLAAGIELSKAAIYYEDYNKFMLIPEKMRLEGEENISNCETNVIEFKEVSYCYPGSDTYALNNVSFVVTSKDKMGIVGENGAGKSTLVKLLLRLYEPSEGVILFNGKNIQTYKYEEYLKQCNAVFQDFSILAYSILDNIVFDQAIDKGHLENILKQTGLNEHISKYQDGLDSMITKKLSNEGINLSGGEQQLLAIARTFYHKSSVVVFDEPTASLDPIKEAMIFELIKKMTKNKIAIFCAHRMSSTKFCDNILVLDKGKIIEAGTHEELMVQKGLYYELYSKQASLYKIKK